MKPEQPGRQVVQAASDGKILPVKSLNLASSLKMTTFLYLCEYMCDYFNQRLLNCGTQATLVIMKSQRRAGRRNHFLSDVCHILQPGPKMTTSFDL